MIYKIKASKKNIVTKKNKLWKTSIPVAILPIVLSACGSTSASTSSSKSISTASVPAGCASIVKQYPQFKGKTLVDALTPFTPGYESVNPKNPNTYVGFDISLLHNIGSCLGFKVSYKPTAFSSLIPTLQAGKANIVVSDIFATAARAKAVNFVTYERVDDGILTKKGNPHHITGFNLSMCGMTAAENTGFVEVPLVQGLAASCKAAGKPAPTVQQYSNNADCIQALLAGRANFYANDVNTVVQAAKAHPNALQKAATLQLPFSVGIAIAKPNTTLLHAVKASLVQIQKDGIEHKLLLKWGLNAGSEEAPKIVS